MVGTWIIINQDNKVGAMTGEVAGGQVGPIVELCNCFINLVPCRITHIRFAVNNARDRFYGYASEFCNVVDRGIWHMFPLVSHVPGKVIKSKLSYLPTLSIMQLYFAFPSLFQSPRPVDRYR